MLRFLLTYLAVGAGLVLIALVFEVRRRVVENRELEQEIVAERQKTASVEHLYQQEKELRAIERLHYIAKVREATDLAEYWHEVYHVAADLPDQEDLAVALRRRVQ